jgi:hypothetical protein
MLAGGLLEFGEARLIGAFSIRPVADDRPKALRGQLLHVAWLNLRRN